MNNEIPHNLFDFGYMPGFDDRLKELAELSEHEDWNYRRTTQRGVLPILHNYVKYTFERLVEEEKIAITPDGQYACFNTGLVTENQEPIYASFEVNRADDRAPWFFKCWLRKGQWELNKFSILPEMAHYFSDPTVLIFDFRKDFRVNVEHIIEDNNERFPESIKKMNNFMLQNLVKGAVDSALERVKRNYKTAIPQYYKKKIQFLLPLCLADAKMADMALAVERHEYFYRASTCLTLDMAYNNARLLAKPDRDWLEP